MRFNQIILLTFGLLASFVISLTPQYSFAEGGSDSCSSSFLGFPTWYRGLTNGDCNVESPKDSDGIKKFVWTIILNIIDIGLTAVGYIAAFFILYGGFRLITNSNSPDAMAEARKTILNAIIGLVISIAAIAIVRLIAGII